MIVKTADCIPVFTIPVVVLLLSFHWSYVQSACLSSCPSNACSSRHNPNAGYCGNAIYVRTTSRQSYQGSESYQGYYYTKCGAFGWRRCHRSRSQYRSVTRYRTIYQSTLRCSTSCCRGYSGSGTNCQPVCASSCRNGGSCSAPNTCTCTSEWTGSTCTIPICSPSCSNGGTCTAPNRCSCTPRWTGRTCTTDVNECTAETHNCQQLCSNTRGGFTCSCKPGYWLLGNRYQCLAPPTSASIRGSSRIVYTNRLNLTCRASGTVDNYKWYLNNKLTTTTIRYYSQSSAQWSDSGSYQCEACNWAGCRNSSRRTVVVIDVPDAVNVSSIEVTNTTFDTISIQWTPPNSNFDSIIDYRVDLYGSGGLVGVFNSSQPMVTLVSLQPFTTYQIRISARNNVGRGGNSSERNVNTLTRDEVLASNLAYSIPRVGVSSYTVELRWAVPKGLLTDKLEGYRLSRWPTNTINIETTTVNKDNASCAWNVTAIGSETYCHEWEGFSPGSQYTVSLEIVYNYSILSTGGPTNVTITIPTLSASHEVGTVGLAVGVVLGVLLSVLVTAVVIIVVLLICKKYRRRKTSGKTEAYYYNQRNGVFLRQEVVSIEGEELSSDPRYKSLDPSSVQQSSYSKLNVGSKSSDPTGITQGTKDYEHPSSKPTPQKKPKPKKKPTKKIPIQPDIVEGSTTTGNNPKCRLSKTKDTDTAAVYKVNKDVSGNPMETVQFEPAYGGNDYTVTDDPQSVNEHLEISKDPHCISEDRVTSQKQHYASLDLKSVQTSVYASLAFKQDLSTAISKYRDNSNNTSEYDPSEKVVPQKKPSTQQTHEYANWNVIVQQHGEGEQSSVDRKSSSKIPSTSGPSVKEVGKETTAPQKSPAFASDVTMPTKKEKETKKHEQREKVPPPTKQQPKTNKKQPLLPPTQQSATPKPQTHPQQPNPVKTGSPLNASPKPPIASKPKKQPLLPKKAPPEQSAVTKQPPPGPNVTELRKIIENKY